MRLMVCDVQMNVDLIVKCGKNEVNNAKTVPYFKLFLCLVSIHCQSIVMSFRN